MKIGILTQPVGDNYGGILQNWALQRVLRDMGHRPLTISLEAQPFGKTVITNVGRTVFHALRAAVRAVTGNEPAAPIQKHPYIYMRRFCKKHIRFAYCLPRFTEAYFRRYGYDAIVVGSDQVWRPKYNQDGRLEVMFCDFLPPQTSVRCVAYAASFGVDNWEMDPEQTAVARRNISKFGHVSVREASGVTLCREHLECRAEHVLDPTLLIDPADYLTLLGEADLAAVPNDAVGVYILDMDAEKKAAVERVCDELGLKPHYFGNLDSEGIYLSTESWLAAFARCRYIITDSYHGTAFAANFGVPFMSIVNPERGADRFRSLLGDLGLESRMALSPDEVNAAALTAPLDTDDIRRRLGRLRTSATAFLADALR